MFTTAFAIETALADICLGSQRTFLFWLSAKATFKEWLFQFLGFFFLFYIRQQSISFVCVKLLTSFYTREECNVNQRINPIIRFFRIIFYYKYASIVIFLSKNEWMDRQTDNFQDVIQIYKVSTLKLAELWPFSFL